MEIIHARYKVKIETTDSSSQEEEDKRNWLDLPPDVTSLIFLKLGTVDILGSVQWVCSSWWKLSKQPLLFRSIQLENVSKIFGYNQNLDFGTFNIFRDLSQGLGKEAIDRSCGQLVKFSIRAMASYDLLYYMSEKSSSLRSLRIMKVGLVAYHYSDIYDDFVAGHDEYIEEIAKKLPHLEEVEFIKCTHFSKDVIKSFGRFCPQLKSLRVNCGRYSLNTTKFNDVALAIAENMSGLRHLNLFGNPMTQDALRVIIDGCPHLESLDLRQCFDYNLGQDLEERCKNIKVLKLPYGPTDDFKYGDDDDDEYKDDGPNYMYEDFHSCGYYD